MFGLDIFTLVLGFVGGVFVTALLAKFNPTLFAKVESASVAATTVHGSNVVANTVAKL